MNTIDMLIGRLSSKVKPVVGSSLLKEIIMIFFLSGIAFSRVIRLNIMRIRNKIRKRIK